MIQPVQFQVAGTQQQPRLALAAQQGTATRPQFVQAEGLQHKIVGPAIQAAHPRVHLLPRGQHQHRQVGVQSAKLREHLLAVFHRHVQIENGQVGQLLAKCLHRGSSVVDQANAMPVGLQTTAEKHSQCPVVFGDQ